MEATNFSQKIILISMLIASLCGLIYELLLGGVLSYLLGDSILFYSITIGLCMLSMGLGSYLSQKIEQELLKKFIILEIILGFIGGSSVPLLFFTAKLSVLSRDNQLPLYIAKMLNSFSPILIVGFILIVSIGLLIGFEIPLLLRVITNNLKLNRGIANLMSFDYIGAFVGSLIFPLFLLPYFGMIKTGFLIGMLNSLAALIILIHSGAVKLFLKVCLFLTMVYLLLGFAFGDKIENFIDRLLYTSHGEYIIESKQSPYQKIILVGNKKSPGLLTLYLNGEWQFSDDYDYAYHKAITFPLSAFRHYAKNILVLGGGDGLVVREILKFSSIERITVVDIDKEMVKIGMKNSYFAEANEYSLHNPKVKIVIADAFKFVLFENNTYDLVIADIASYNVETITKFYSKQFFQCLKRIMNNGGIFVTSYTGFSGDLLFKIVIPCFKNTVETAGLHFYCYSYYKREGYEDYFMLVSVKPLDFEEGLHIIKDDGQEILIKPCQIDGFSKKNKKKINSIYSPVLSWHIRRLRRMTIFEK